MPLIKRRNKKDFRRLFVEELEGRRLLAVAPAVSDLNDDGRVNNSDLAVLRTALNGPVGIDLNPNAAGLQGYHEGLDLNFDGTTINTLDYQAVYDNWGKTGIPTSPTSLVGRVFDNYGNPLEGVLVSIDNTAYSDLSDESGIFNIMGIGTDGRGFRKLTFDGSGAVDPTPGVGSGEFPTIPHKPLFINGGTQVRFRDMSLPERDLTGSVDLSVGGIATETGPNAWTLNQAIIVDNAGVNLKVPAGSTVTFPPGEHPRISITRVDPARVPIPMPTNLSSTLFITYQPGGTMISGPGPIITEFDNTDGYLWDKNVPANNNLIPGLAGVVDGVFSKIGTTVIVDSDGDMVQTGDPDDTLHAEVPTPFEFAWYHVDILNPPCSRTIVTGQVKQFGTNAPIANAMASVPGIGPVPTNENGVFFVNNVPAGPNGPNCFNNRFNIRASASKDLHAPVGLQADEVGTSAIVPAVPGGITDVGMIFLGVEGGSVNGQVSRLVSIDPFLTEPVVNIPIEITSLSLQGINPIAVTGLGGNYNFPDVPLGDYSQPFVNSFFDVYFDSNPNDTTINPSGDVDVHDFKTVGRGSVWVHVVDSDGNDVPNRFVQVDSQQQDLGGGYTSPGGFCSGNTDGSGMFLCEGDGYGGDGYGGNALPLGNFDVRVFNNNFFVVDGFGSGRINRTGEHVMVQIVTRQLGDIESVQFANGVQDPGGANTPVLATNVFYDFEVQGEIVDQAQLELVIEFDTDQNQTTGTTSEIDQLFAFPDPADTGLGVDFRTRCFVTEYEADCNIEDGDGDILGIPVVVGFGLLPGGGIDGSHLIITTPKSIFGGATVANVAVLSAFNPFFVEFNTLVGGDFGAILDVVPNSGPTPGSGASIPVNLVTGGVTVPDALGDTFSANVPSLLGESSSNELPPSALLNSTSLNAAIDGAIRAWSSTGLSAEQLRTIQSIPVRITDLPGPVLGYAPENRIYIDRSAAGFGWHFGDSAPPANRMDLQTALTHEFGHILGLGHDHEHGDSVMAPRLRPGERLLLTGDSSSDGLKTDLASILVTIGSEVKRSENSIRTTEEVFGLLGAKRTGRSVSSDLAMTLVSQRANAKSKLKDRDASHDSKRLPGRDELADEDLLDLLASESSSSGSYE